MTLFKVILLKGLLLQKPNIKNKITDVVYYDEEWDCGEVSWFNYDENKYNYNYDEYKNLNNTFIEYNNEKLITPLKDIIKKDQMILASTSALIKTSYKELFTFDMLITEVNNLFNSKLFKVLTPTPTELLIFGVLYIVYNKTKKTEITRLKTLYKFDEKAEYFNKYTEFRKIIMMLFIFLSIIFTKNVQYVL